MKTDEQVAHTATPWNAYSQHGELVIESLKETVAKVCTLNRADAQFIVTACNAWNDKDALRKRLAELEAEGA